MFVSWGVDTGPIVLQGGIGGVTGWLGVLILAGLLVPVLYLGATYLRQWLALRTFERVSVAEAANADGPVALEGTAVADDPVEPMLADEESVAYRYYGKSITPTRMDWNPRNPIESPLEDGASFSTPWRTVGKGEEMASFWLEDDTGRIRVEPDDATLYVTGGKVQTEVDPSRDLASQLSAVSEDAIVRDKRDVYDGHGEIMTFVWSVLNWRDRWYREGHIADGEQVFVAGSVERDGAGHADGGTVAATVRSDGSSGPFVITNRSQKDHSRKLLYLSALIFIVAAVFVGLAGWGLLQTL